MKRCTRVLKLTRKTAPLLGTVIALCCVPTIISSSSAVAAFFSMAASTSDKPRCRPVVLCGPSGAGKSTLIERLRKEFPDDFGFSVSHTTRDPRQGERDGVDYNFVTKDGMEKEIEEGKFLEHAHVHGNIYGTSFAAVERVSQANKICILDIDIQGVMSCKKLKFDADKYVFIAPPSLEVLETRLRGRGTETEERIQKRLRGAVGEMEAAKSVVWDGYIVNDDLEKAYAALKEITAHARSQRALALQEAEAHVSSSQLPAATTST